MRRPPGGGGIGLPETLRGGPAGGSGAAGVAGAAGGAGATAAAAAAAGRSTGRSTGAGRAGPMSGMTPVERTTRCGAGGSSAMAGSAPAAGATRSGSMSVTEAAAGSTISGAAGGSMVAGSGAGAVVAADRLLGRSLLGDGLLRRFGLLDDRLAAQTLGVGEAPDAVRERVVDARRVALDADLQALTEIEHHLVLDAELPRQLVDPDLLGGHQPSQFRT